MRSAPFLFPALPHYFRNATPSSIFLLQFAEDGIPNIRTSSLTLKPGMFRAIRDFRSMR
jgi:hypothetical protein